IQGPRYFFPVPFTYILIAFGLSCLLRPIYHKVWRGSPSVLKVGIVSLVCSAMAAFLWLLISQLLFWAFDFGPYPKNVALPGYLLTTFIYTLSHHKPFLFLSWSALYFGIKYWQDKQRQEARALRADALAKEAELRMLRYQINPHFLFNSLNSVSALIREDARRAEKMLNELSEFLRYSLAGAKIGAVPLGEELEAARNYLDIEKIRFEDKLAVKIDASPAAEDFRVPSLIIHPLVENAVKYGMRTSPLPLNLEISARAENGALHLSITNTGKWIDANGAANDKGSGIGLTNVRQRLEQVFPQKHKFDVFERDGRVHAVIDIRRD
ncbi:MAG: histidine kinase, partial [Acidobacteria bacterium]|nr:histidine kinase [Acidobacteriota bacterium]